MLLGMKITSHYVTPPHRCSYLPAQTAMLEYLDCDTLTVEEYDQMLANGWRRFGRSLFRPRCPFCSSCWSLRVLTEQFTMNRSQRRNARDNRDRVRLEITSPSVSEAKLLLHDAFHTHQSEEIGWPRYPPKDFSSYVSSFVNNPIPTEEWCYYDGPRLIGVGYVDVVPSGLSAIYYFHDPQYRDWGLGTWNVLQVMEQARERHRPFVYLGYYVDGCRSLEYKAHFGPHELHEPNSNRWRLPVV
jgi:arginine-tRNA-protein transferase